MFFFGQSGCVGGENSCIRTKVVVFSQSGSIRLKMVVFGKSGCIWAKVVVVA